MLGDRLGNGHPRGYALVPAVAFAITLPAYLLAFSSTSLWTASLLFLVPTALGLTWLGPVVTAITRLVPPEMRATASALFLFINNLIGLGLGSTVIGAISDALLDQFLESKPNGLASSLTHREREVVQQVAEGRINKEIAQRLNISVKTVETHRASAMRKLKLRTTADLVRYAVRNQLIQA